MSERYDILQHERFLARRDWENQEKLDAIAQGKPMPERRGTGTARNPYVTKEDRRKVMELHRAMNWKEAHEAEKRRDGVLPPRELELAEESLAIIAEQE